MQISKLLDNVIDTYQCWPIVRALQLWVLLLVLAQSELPILPERLAVTPPVAGKRRIALGFVLLKSILVCGQLEQIFERIGLLNYPSVRGLGPLICCFLILLVDAE